MITRTKLLKVSSEEGIPGVTNTEPGWGSETWSDGKVSFLLQYSPDACNVYPPAEVCKQAMIDVAGELCIKYRYSPTIGGEVIVVEPTDGERLMHSVYERIDDSA